MRLISFTVLSLLLFSIPAIAQEFRITKTLPESAMVDIRNLSGRVSISVSENAKTDTSARSSSEITVSAVSEKGVTESEVKLDTGTKTTVVVTPFDQRKRIDLIVTLPARSSVKVETLAGAVDVSGNLALIEVKTDTGTVSTDIPDESIDYDLLWTASKPRFLADFELEKTKEGSGGKFTIRGHYPGDPKVQKDKTTDKPLIPKSTKTVDSLIETPASETDKTKKKKGKVEADPTSRDITLRINTARGIVLLNVDASEVGSDLRERPLTTAAKSIIRSGDSFLMDAIRRASPKYFGDYMRTLPPPLRQPYITEKTSLTETSATEVRTMLVSVTDLYNRSIGDLDAKDFEVVENGETRDVMSVRPVTAPFNLVLLLDVSGSVDKYVNFIRKAARAFVDTMQPYDRIAIVTFNDDVHLLSTFTTDKAALSASLDSFDAGGGTAYYDALAYTLAETLRPLRGDRTAIVVLTDGDDNRSFLPFDALKGTIQESGALIYPLYVPSSLIAASETNRGQNDSMDLLRRKYMGLTTKAEGEGPKLAQASGGVYYPITQLAQIQTAYDDIAKQLRTAYSVTFRSGAGDSKTSSRLRIKVKRENAFVKFATQ